MSQLTSHLTFPLVSTQSVSKDKIKGEKNVASELSTTILNNETINKGWKYITEEIVTIFHHSSCSQKFYASSVSCPYWHNQMHASCPFASLWDGLWKKL